jgi:hypothetical protein
MQILHLIGSDLYEKDFVFDWPILINDSISLTPQKLETTEYIGNDYEFNFPIEFQNKPLSFTSVAELLESSPEYFINFNINSINFIGLPTRFRT